jgi:peptidoglycan/LPS O-acetylase OafA/YrhL
MRQTIIYHEDTADSDFVDIAKGFSIIAVISWHVLSPFFDLAPHAQIGAGLDSPFDYAIIVLLHSLGFGSSCFLVLSGYILSRRYSTLDLSLKSFYTKRLLRIYVPFVLWLPVYLLMSQNVKDLGDVIFRVAFFEGSYHFWFIWVILCCYLLFPMILYSQKRLSPENPSDLSYLSYLLLPLILLVASVIVLTIGRLHITNSWTINFIINDKVLILPGNLFYFVCGVSMGRMWGRDVQPLIDYSKYVRVLVLAAICIASARVFLFASPDGYCIWKHGSFVLERLYMVLAITIVFLVSSSKTNDGFAAKVLKTLGRSSYGVFLGHAAILYASRSLLYPLFGDQSFLCAMCVFIITLIVCYCLCIPKRSRMLHSLGFSSKVPKIYLMPLLSDLRSRCRAVNSLLSSFRLFLFSSITWRNRSCRVKPTT